MPKMVSTSRREVKWFRTKLWAQLPAGEHGATAGAALATPRPFGGPPHLRAAIAGIPQHVWPLVRLAGIRQNLGGEQVRLGDIRCCAL